MTLDYTSKAHRRVLAVAARRVIRQGTGFAGDLSRHMQISRERALELLRALAVLEVVEPPNPSGAASWGVLIPAERAQEIYAAILEGPTS